MLAIALEASFATVGRARVRVSESEERDFKGHDSARRGCSTGMYWASSDEDELIAIGDDPSDADTPTPGQAISWGESEALTDVEETPSSEESPIVKKLD